MKQPTTHPPVELHTQPGPQGVPAAALTQDATPPELPEDVAPEEEELDVVEPLAGKEALRDEEDTVPLDDEEVAPPEEDTTAPLLLVLETNWDGPQSPPPQWPLVHA